MVWYGEYAEGADEEIQKQVMAAWKEGKKKGVFAILPIQGAEELERNISNLYHTAFYSLPPFSLLAQKEVTEFEESIQSKWQEAKESFSPEDLQVMAKFGNEALSLLAREELDTRTTL